MWLKPAIHIYLNRPSAEADGKSKGVNQTKVQKENIFYMNFRVLCYLEWVFIFSNYNTKKRTT